MTRAELARKALNLRLNAADTLLLYALTNCPNARIKEVTALIRALGDISVDEGLATLDRIEAGSR